MKTCNNCNQKVNNEVKFCPNCGSNEFRTKKTKTIIILIVLILIAAIAITSILLIYKKNKNHDNDTTSNTNISNTNIVDANISGTTDAAQTSNDILAEVPEENTFNDFISVDDGFSEEKNWITYSNNGSRFVACVNKEGEALFKYNANDVAVKAGFSNNFAYITYKGDFSVVDTTGTIVSSYPSDKFGDVKAYGDGYTLTEKYYSDFDTAYYLYSIYNSDGSLVTDFTLNDDGQIRAANYCGEGVFGIQLRGNWSDPTEFYCINTDKFVKLQGNINCKFDNKLALVNIEYADPDESGYRARLVLLSPEGTYSYVPVYPTNGWNWSENTNIKESSCILFWPFSDDGVFINYDIESKQFFKADDYYIEKINWDERPEDMTYDSGVIAMPLKGSDNKNYVVVFDNKMKNVTKPIECDSFRAYKSGRMILIKSNDTFVYDEKGSIVFTLSEIGCSNITDFSNGIAIADDKKCIDTNGNVVFELDKIDYSKANTIN